MRSKWSKIIRHEEDDLAIESFEMLELTPLAPVHEQQETSSEEENKEAEPPHDCSLLQEQAYQAGREAGIEEGKAQLQAEHELEMKRAFDLVAQVGVARLEAVRQAEIDTVELALGVAKKIIHREARVDKEIVVNQLHQALTLTSTKSLIRIKVHPDDVGPLETVQSQISNREGQPLPILIEGDALIAQGGCVVAADTMFLDATIDRQLDVISRELIQGIPKDGCNDPD